MNKRESFSWVLAAIGGIVAIISAAGAYHIYMNSIHAPAGESRVRDAAIILSMESQNQSLTNHYLRNKEKGVMPEEAEEQLQRLEYDRSGIKQLKQQVLGVDED